MNRLFSSGILVIVTIMCVDGCFQMPAGMQPYLGCLLPMDPRVCVSDTVTFTCLLRDKPESNRAIRFRTKTTTSPVWSVVEEGDITVVNTSMSQYTHTVSVSDAPVTAVQCFYSEPTHRSTPNLDNQLDAISTMISSHPSNPKVADFNCIVYNYVDSLNCSWKYAGYYEDTPTVSFNWRISGFEDWMSCPDLNSESNYCHINDQFVSTKMIDIQIVLNYQTCGENPERNVTFNYTVDTRKIVKPHPVDGLTGVAISSTCMHLDWNTANSRPEYSKIHEIRATSEWHKDKTVEVITGPTDFKALHNYSFCGLQEYTKYTFRIRIKPVEPTYGGYWSNERSTMSWTSSAVPSASPNVTTGGYSWNPQVCQSDNTRRVCFMLQSIEGIEENGDMIGLEVIGKPDTGEYSITTTDEHLFAEDSTYFCTSLSCRESYKVMITAINDAGKSNKTSTIFVERWNEDIVQPSLKVETSPDSNQTVYLHWSHPQVDNAVGYNVFYCTKYNGGCKMSDGVMDWTSYPIDIQDVEMDIVSAELFSYGVSLVTERGSSGLQWETCVYTKAACPTKAVLNVVVSTGSEDDTLVVNWDKLPCQSGEPYIDHYIITYCEYSTSTCYDEDASGNTGRLIIDDLEQKKYFVKVKGVNDEGCSGPYSNLEYGTPEHNALEPEQIVGIATPSLFVVIMAVIGLTYCLRRSKACFTKWKHQVGAVTLPVDIDVYSKSNYGRQRSHESVDSGFDTPNPEEFKKPEFKFIKDGYVVAVTIDPITEEGELINVLSDLQTTKNDHSMTVQNAHIVGFLHDIPPAAVPNQSSEYVADTEVESSLDTAQSSETGNIDMDVSSGYNITILPNNVINRRPGIEHVDSENNSDATNLPIGTGHGIAEANEKLLTLTSIPTPVTSVPDIEYLQLSTADDDNCILPKPSSSSPNVNEQIQYGSNRQSSNLTPNSYVSSQFMCGENIQTSNQTPDSDISTSEMFADNNAYISHCDPIISCNVNSPRAPITNQVDASDEIPVEYGVDNLFAPQPFDYVSLPVQHDADQTDIVSHPNVKSPLTCMHDNNRCNERMVPLSSVQKRATSSEEFTHFETPDGAHDYESNDCRPLTITTPYVQWR